MGYLLKEALKTLCGVNQWSYAIFWKIGCQNPKLLIWEECYYEPVIYSNVGHGGNKIHLLVTKMMEDNYIYLLGEGLVGRAAFTRNHQWIITDNKLPGVHPLEVSNEVFTQFSAGIQTIAVIPVHPHGVVQLGSSSTIMENVGFVNEVKDLISQLGCVPGALLSENYMKSEVGPTHASGSSRHSGDNRVVNGLTSQQIEMIPQAKLYPKNNQEIGFGSFLANYEQPILSNSFSSGKLEHELFQALSMSSEEEQYKPQSRDDLFDIVGMEFKTKLFKGNRENVNNHRTALAIPIPSADSDLFSIYEGESKSGISSDDHLLDAVVSKLPSASSSKPIPSENFSDSSSIISSQIGSWSDQRQDMRKNEYDNVIAIAKRGDEIGKSNRKRLKPGENPRPRPKDRQMIQDRVKELREIVPNSAKCSIDALLDRTIKHMLFLQSVTKHADKLKQTKIARKEGLSRDNFEGGATWAYEVGSQSMVGQCPIIVEDLNGHGQMLVEMVCEETCSFLEIAHVIRGLGLTILKGVMESRNDKIWAHFNVEANRDVTRMEIFISLVGLFDQSAKKGGLELDNPVPVVVNEQSFPFQQLTT